MKRIKLILLFSIISTTGIFAQTYSAAQRFDYDNYRQNRLELRDFEYELDQFSYALMTENIREARIAKRHILEDMEREIQQTRRELRRWSRSYRNPYFKNLDPDWHIPKMHSRENGARASYSDMIHRLEKQERLYYRFSELQLTSRRRGIVNENEHRRIMYRFKETMRDNLYDVRLERTNPRRGR